MRLTKQADCALRVLMYLAAADRRPVTALSMARRLGVPTSQVTGVLATLVQHHFVDSCSDTDAAYCLSRPIIAIRLGEVVRHFAPARIEEGCEYCLSRVPCRMRIAVAEGARAFIQELDAYTLADIVGDGYQRLALVT